LLKLIENFVNAELIPEFGVEGIEFTYIYDDPSEKAAKLNNWKMEIDMGIKTSNEVREELGLAPIDGGDSTPQDREQQQFEQSQNNQNNNNQNNEGPKEPKEVKKALFEDIILNAANTYGIPYEAVKEGFEHELEHIGTVGNNPNIILQIALDHLKEDKEYYIKLRKIEKGVDDGQYYREPFNVIQPDKGKIVQPQNPQPRDSPIKSEQFQDGDYTRCPICAMTTVRLITSSDDVNRDNEYNCINCGATLSQTEMEENMLMFEQWQQNNNTSAVSIPRWSPK